MLWPKLIVNLTNPVRGGGDTSTNSISHPNLTTPVRGGHRAPTDCLEDHTETILMPLFVNEWQYLSLVAKDTWLLDSNTSKRGATSAQRLREYIGIQKFMSTSEIRHSHAVSQAVEVVSVYLHHRPSFWVNLPPVRSFPGCPTESFVGQVNDRLITSSSKRCGHSRTISE